MNWPIGKILGEGLPLQIFGSKTFEWLFEGLNHVFRDQKFFNIAQNTLTFLCTLRPFQWCQNRLKQNLYEEDMDRKIDLSNLTTMVPSGFHINSHYPQKWR